VNLSMTNPVSGGEDDDPPYGGAAALTSPAPRRQAEWRKTLRSQALVNAMNKRAAGVPSYSVPEAAALLSISQEYLYRLIQADGFPAVRMRCGRGQGRYIVPAKAVDQMLDSANAAGACVESSELTEQWWKQPVGGT
jgi:excisionase family DNA binding protein